MDRAGKVNFRCLHQSYKVYLILDFVKSFRGRETKLKAAKIGSQQAFQDARVLRKQIFTP